VTFVTQFLIIKSEGLRHIGDIGGKNYNQFASVLWIIVWCGYELVLAMPSIFCDTRLQYPCSSQRSRVDSFDANKKSSQKRDELIQSCDQLIEQCYRQIFFHAMTADRDVSLESQLRSGSITVRDFIRGLLLSERFYRGYILCNSNERIVEQVIGRVLGRSVYNSEEVLSWSIVIAGQGFAKFIDLILDGTEYMDRFGYDSMPVQINRLIPGQAIGEVPIYQKLPRYSEYWRDKLISSKMMMSIDQFNTYSLRRASVASLIYDKPEGRALTIWTLLLSIGSIGALIIVLSIFNATFTVR